MKKRRVQKKRKFGNHVSPNKQSFKGPGSVGRGLDLGGQAKICARKLGSVASRGLPWPPGGLPWPPVASRGLSWPNVASRGLPWPPVASRGLPCPPVASRGLPCPPVASRGLPWSPAWPPVVSSVASRSLYLDFGSSGMVFLLKFVTLGPSVILLSTNFVWGHSPASFLLCSCRFF